MSYYIVTPIIYQNGIEHRGVAITCDSYKAAVDLATHKIAIERIWKGYEIKKLERIVRSPAILSFKDYEEANDGFR